MLNRHNSEELILGLLKAPPTEIDDTVKDLIRGAETKGDWGHAYKVAKDFNLTTAFALAIIKTIYNEWEE